MEGLLQDELSLPACFDDEPRCGRLSLEELPQKNTFIHYDIPCERPPTPTSSAPGVLLSRLFKTKPQSSANMQSQELPMESSFSTESVLSSLTEKSTTRIGDFENDSQASTSAADSTMGSPVEVNDASKIDFALDVKATAEEMHRLRQCTPCNYYWYKADGCRQGSACQFCHLCPKGEIKRRKKDKLRQMRKYSKPIGALY